MLWKVKAVIGQIVWKLFLIFNWLFVIYLFKGQKMKGGGCFALIHIWLCGWVCGFGREKELLNLKFIETVILLDQTLFWKLTATLYF